MIKRICALVYARNLEFFRDRASLTWNLVFPFLVIFGFGFGFSGGGQSLFKVGIYKSAESTHEHYAFLDTQFVNFVGVIDLEESKKKLAHHQYDMLISFSQGFVEYWINKSAPKGYLLERLLFSTPFSANANTTPAFQLIKQNIEGREIRYVDWLIAGMLGMNMMFSALFGVGYSIVRYRKNGVLKRLKASPITSFEFISSQIISRLFIILVVSSIIFIGSKYAVNFIMLGSYSLLLLVFFVGSLCLISLGLLVAATVRSEEFAGGMLQLISWPMMFLSGVWFSLEGFSPVVKKMALIFPLTHVTEAARAIMTEGATFREIQNHLTVLSVLSVVFIYLSSRVFKWE